MIGILEVIVEVIEYFKDYFFLIDDVVEKMGILRVFIWKYLKFLIDIGFFGERMIYGIIGWFVYVYLYNE